MATDKRGPTVPPIPPDSRPQRPTPDAPGSTLQTSGAYLRDVANREAPYLKFAFSNPYNLSLFLGSLAAATITFSPVLAFVALGGEAVWLLNAPGSNLLRRLLWDPKHEKLRADAEAAQRAARVSGLADAERQRVTALVQQQQQIRRLSASNPSLTGELLRSELVKTDRLVEAFIDMAVTCARYTGYLESVDLALLERDRARWDRTIQAGAARDPQVDIAKKNLAIIVRRQEKMKEIQRYLSVARGQLDLIENSFQLIADQIVTMQSPQQLSGQLDELLDGVEAIRQAAADTEQLLTGALGSTT